MCLSTFDLVCAVNVRVCLCSHVYVLVCVHAYENLCLYVYTCMMCMHAYLIILFSL